MAAGAPGEDNARGAGGRVGGGGGGGAVRGRGAAGVGVRVSRSGPLYFQFCPLYDPNTGERLYGASVKCGEVMHKSCARAQSRWVWVTKGVLITCAHILI